MTIQDILQTLIGTAEIRRAVRLKGEGKFFGSGHRHRALSHIDYLDQGSVVIDLERRSYRVTSGQVVFVPGGWWHASSQDQASADRYTVHSLSFTVASPVRRWSLPPIVTIADRTAFILLFRELIDEFHMRHPERDLNLRLNLARLLFLIWRDGRRRLRASASVEQVTEDVVASKIQHAMGYIQDHYARKLTLREIAAAIHVSPSWLSHRFRAFTGVAPIRYLINYRFAQALRLMHQTPDKLDSIVGQVGFNDPHYFFRLFKQRYRCSPRRYIRLTQTGALVPE